MKPIPFIALFFSIPAFSASWHPFLGASLGASFAKLSHPSPQIAYLSGDTITDAYPLNNTQVSSPFIGLNGGMEATDIYKNLSLDLGLGIYTNASDYHYQGQVIETAAGDPSSLLYDYSYQVNATRVMAEMQLNWVRHLFSPFINVGLGPTWNRTNWYHEKAATMDGYPPLPPFRANTHTNVAFQAGGGISTSFNFISTDSHALHERLSLGYRYANLGNTSFDTRGSMYPYALNTGLLSINDIYLSYTYFI